MNILISSNNKDKIKEIISIFQISGINLKTLAEFPNAPEVVEDGNTLKDNALKKAMILFEFTGLPTIADDTGLAVDALNGAPGIYSARYAGENVTYDDNVKKLLFEMKSFPEMERTARFETCAVFYHPDLVLTAFGSVEGIILDHRRGNSGFGYDPVFFLPDLNKTFAELTIKEKNEISHRGKAFKALHKNILENLPLLNIKD